MEHSKTIREWLETLPEPLRSLALENARNFRKPSHLDSLQPSLGDAVDYSFYWEQTLQGHLFWLEVKIEANRNNSVITQAWADRHMRPLTLPPITVIEVTKPKNQWPRSSSSR